MQTYIALFRGINVGGNNILPMRNLVELLEALGLRFVKTYIQSGNAVFQSETSNAAELEQQISTTIGQHFGFSPQVLLLTITAFQDVIAANPFPSGENEPKSLHLYFLDSAPENPDLEMLKNLKANDEQFELLGNVFYLYASAGIGRSKLANKVEKALGVRATARNWRSVSKIHVLATETAQLS